MALTSINRAFELTSPGQLFLYAYPGADPGVSNTARLNAMFQYFYAAGDTRTTLSATAYANISADGVKVKVKEDVVENETNETAKHVVARTGMAIDLEFTFFDTDVAHLYDMLGCKSDELITLAAATGKAGRKQLLIGGARTQPKYVVMYRTPSQTWIGQYDNFLFLRCVVTVDFELALNKKDIRKATVKVSCLPDSYILNADGFPEYAVFDEVSAAAL